MKTANIEISCTSKVPLNIKRSSRAKSPQPSTKPRLTNVVDLVRTQIDKKQTDSHLPCPIVYCCFAQEPNGETPQELLVLAYAKGVLRAVTIQWAAIVNGTSDPKFEQELVRPTWKRFRDPKARRELIAVLRDHVLGRVLVLEGDGYHAITGPKGQTVAEVFVLGEKARLISGQVAMPIFLKPSQNPHRTSGTLEGWQKGIGHHLKGHPRLLLVVLAALAPLLAKLLGATCPALFLNGSSSTGKSTLLRVALSVMTASESLTTASGTKLGVREVAQRNQGHLTILDEIASADDPSMAIDLIFEVEGQSVRHRAGNGRNSTPSSAPLDTALCMANEHSVADLLRRHTRDGTQGVLGRTLEVMPGKHGMFSRVPDNCQPGDFARALSETATANGGNVLPKWIRVLGRLALNDRDSWRHRYGEVGAQLCDDLEIKDPVQRRLAHGVAIWVVAGEIAADNGLLQIDSSLPYKAIRYLLKQRLKHWPGVGTNESLIRPVARAVNALAPGLRDWSEALNKGATVNYHRREQNRNLLLIKPAALAELLSNGTDGTRTKNALVEAGLLLRSKDGYAKQVVMPGTKNKPRFYVFDEKILSFE